MSEPVYNPVSARVARIFVVFSGALALVHAIMLGYAWREWRSGAPDIYPGQHAGLVSSAARGILLAVALPVGVLLTRAGRRQRMILWATWTVAMLGYFALLAWKR